MHRMRKLLWRRLAKVDCKLKCASTMQKKAKLLQQRWDLEKQLADDYLSVNTSKENDAVLRIKENPKASLHLLGRGRTQDPELAHLWTQQQAAQTLLQIIAVKHSSSNMKVYLLPRALSGRWKTWRNT